MRFVLNSFSFEGFVLIMDTAMGSLNLFNSAMNKAEFKEKLGRLIQYGAKMVSGVLSDSNAASTTEGKELIAKVR